MTASSLLVIAQASGTASSGPGGLLGSPMVFPVLMIVMMYFLLIRPQRKKAQEQENLQKSAKVGDQVVTIGGLHGIITSVKEKTVMVKIADNVKVEFDKTAIASFTKRTDEPAAAVVPTATAS